MHFFKLAEFTSRAAITAESGEGRSHSGSPSLARRPPRSRDSRPDRGTLPISLHLEDDRNVPRLSSSHVKGPFTILSSNVKCIFRELKNSIVQKLCLYSQDATGGQLMGQNARFRLQWSAGRHALKPQRQLVFWCGPRRGKNQ